MSSDQLNQLVQEHLKYSGGSISTKWKIDKSTFGGRGLFATDDISAGETLFVDAPLIRGPRARSNQQKGCTVCNKLNNNEKIFKCYKCALLLCSKTCQNTELHMNDCETISSWANKIPIGEMDDTRLSRALTPIRVLKLNEKQKRFIATLKSHTLPQHGHEIRALKDYFVIPEKDEALMMLTCYVMDTNAFQIASPYNKEEISMRGLYPVACLMNHNCTPNTRQDFLCDFRMSVKASKFIEKGSEIFTCYSGLLWGTPARRHHLYKTKHFWCNCERCADPTERGTRLSALKCFTLDCPGSLLPLEPLRSATSWRCSECDITVPSKNIAAIQGALGSLLGNLKFTNVQQLEDFLKNRICKFIPHTNQIVVDLQCRLIWLLGEEEGARWHGELNIVLL